MDSQVLEWYKLYGIEPQTLNAMYKQDTALEICCNNPGLTGAIFLKNSQLLQQFLAELPPPSKHTNRCAITIDFMYPTQKTYQTLFEGVGHPKFHFEKMDEEIATFFYDDQATEFYNGPWTKTNPPTMNLPLYLQTIGFAQQGWHHLINKVVPPFILKKFFIYEMCIGDRFDHRKNIIVLNHDNVGIGGLADGYPLYYICHSQLDGLYNPTSTCDQSEELDFFWNSQEIGKIETSIKQLQSLFFKREEKPITTEEEALEKAQLIEMDADFNSGFWKE